MKPEARYVGAPLAPAMSTVTESLAAGGVGAVQWAPLVALPPTPWLLPSAVVPPEFFVPPVVPPLPLSPLLAIPLFGVPPVAAPPLLVMRFDEPPKEREPPEPSIPPVAVLPALTAVPLAVFALVVPPNCREV